MSQYWINTGDQIDGPFNASQLKRLALKGKLIQIHQVSTDQKRWVSAGTVKGLKFPTEQVPAASSPEVPVDDSEDTYRLAPLLKTQADSHIQPPQVPEAVRKAANSSVRPVPARKKEEDSVGDRWFCRIQGQEMGPIAFAGIKKLVAAGTLTPADLIRSSSQTAWVRALTIVGLFDQPIDEISIGSKGYDSGPVGFIFLLISLLAAIVSLVFVFVRVVPVGRFSSVIDDLDRMKDTAVEARVFDFSYSPVMWAFPLIFAYPIFAVISYRHRVASGKPTEEKYFLRRYPGNDIVVLVQEYSSSTRIGEREESRFSALEFWHEEQIESGKAVNVHKLRLTGIGVEPIMLTTTKSEDELQQSIERFQEFTRFEVREAEAPPTDY